MCLSVQAASRLECRSLQQGVRQDTFYPPQLECTLFLTQRTGMA